MVGVFKLIFELSSTRVHVCFFDGIRTILFLETILITLTRRKGPESRHFYMEKGSIFSILACFRQNRDNGNSAKIKKKIKIHCLVLIPITYLTQYEPNWGTLTN